MKHSSAHGYTDNEKDVTLMEIYVNGRGEKVRTIMNMIFNVIRTTRA